MKNAQERVRWIDEVEEVFEECKRNIGEAVKDYESAITSAIDELKVELKS